MRFIGRTIGAITLHTPAALAAKGRTAALTENFLPVELAAAPRSMGPVAANQLLNVRICAIKLDGTLEAAAGRIEPPLRLPMRHEADPVLG
jgi:hypothetical protein